jgi:hypothetical protein
LRRKSLILYTTLAAFAALIASRVNRFPPPQLKPPPHASSLDEIIPDVTVDLHTLDKAIRSMAAKARTHLSIDPGLSATNQRTTLITQGFLHVRNVRLGVLLATILEGCPSGDWIHCNVEENKITLYLDTAPPPPVLTRRLYNLRPMVADLTTIETREQNGNPRRPPQQIGSIFSSQRIWQSDASQSDRRCAEFIISAMNGKEKEIAIVGNWSGWVIVQATPEMQRRFESFVALWSNANLMSPEASEMQTYHYREFPELNAQWNSKAQNANTTGRMSKMLSRIKCDKLPLERFISVISQNADVTPCVSWQELTGASAAGAKSPVTLDLKNVTAATALQAALDQCQSAGDPLGFVCVDAFLKISVKRMLNDWSIRIYDVNDLIEYIARQSRQTRSTPPQVVLSLAKEKNVDLKNVRKADESLLFLFISKFDKTWQDSTQMDLFAGKLVVHATSENHKVIATMLATMRSNEK